MATPAQLEVFRNQRLFDGWEEFVAAEHVQAAEASLRQLVEDLLAGASRTEVAAREAVAICVERFNGLDDGWIVTIEREDIFEKICDVIDACGFDCDEEWLAGREW
jgi:hypothetical protein